MTPSLRQVDCSGYNSKEHSSRLGESEPDLVMVAGPVDLSPCSVLDPATYCSETVRVASVRFTGANYMSPDHFSQSRMSRIAI
ncbi:hypothetical protein RRG08_024626 [Elysia crispata]|uniref:Uncharacterized protein n=1 Tax=Elysia crispata TaxID=231223 RepID=A0AAE1DNH5_9GAST|nr:hypothetical protein RRG08_024626 [Elysia crispata]